MASVVLLVANQKQHQQSS